jgi:methionyl-tRNA formyltransferase
MGATDMTRVVFMGTPAFALPSLERLAENYDVVTVVTQPDRPAGRKRRLTPPPVKEAALARGLPLWQPPTLRAPAAVTHLRALAPDLIVVVAFGQILRANVLEIPPHGCLNVHGSLLPKYRGAAPVPAAILAGEAETGVTLMRMDEGMDTGPIMAQATCAIGPDDTTTSLADRLCRLGADLLVETLPRWLAGKIVPRPQDESQATYCRTIAKSDGWLDWGLPAEVLARQVRAYIPWPTAFTSWQGRPLKVLRALPLPDWRGAGQPGQAIALDDGMGAVTGQGALQLLEVQLAGKRAMEMGDFLRGQRGFAGSVLGLERNAEKRRQE